MRAPRSVALTPMAWPSRSLNWATDFVAAMTARLLPGDHRHVRDGAR